MLLDEPLWYKDAVFYEVHVRAFCDAVGDGFGDFRGLTQKLDYLQDLGVTAIWLLPFYSSPLRDDGYDIADYCSIHSHYGDLDDFRELLAQAHERGLRVITELVVNHTSDQHPWFQRARRAPAGSPERDFYVWSDSPEKYRDARIIFKDFETSNWTYDHVAQAFFWHRFYSHQPDLNFDNPAVWEALLPVVDFWMGMGVDGMRLDAVPYLYEREGTNCENLPETHEFLRALRRHVDERFPNRLLLAEANQWPEDAVAYFGQGDECHMAFHFPVMPRLFMAMHMEDRFPVVDILDQTPTIPDSCQWAMFLRNHDELTLEMVTDEERDYMYRAYAHDRQARVNLGIRRRLAPLLGNNRRRIELMNGLLFSLPGTPVLYYGDEIGMGDNIYLGDRNGVRTPMQWSADRNAGFSRANPQKLFLPIIIDPEYHYEAINVEAQQNNPNSLLWWMKRLIGHRRKHKALGRGSIQFLQPENRRILAFVRQFEEERILVVANLSRFVQFVELDLSSYAGVKPIELFGSTTFPKITNAPYMLTLAPHAFYWFSLSPESVTAAAGVEPKPARAVPVIWTTKDWQHLFESSGTRKLGETLRNYLDRIEVTGAHRVLRGVNVRETFRVPYANSVAFVVIVEVDFNEGSPENHVVALAYATNEELAAWPAGSEPRVLARIDGPTAGVLFNALRIPAFCDAILNCISQNMTLDGSADGELLARKSAAFEGLRGPEEDYLQATSGTVEQSNTSIRYGNRLILKAYRRIEEGIHPELEVGRFLTDDYSLACVAPVAGFIQYRGRRSEPMTLGVLHGFVANEGDAWQYTLDVLSVFFEHMATSAPPDLLTTMPLRRRLSEHVGGPPTVATDLLHGYLEMVRLLGRRLAEVHLALASDSSQPEFIPESFSRQYQRAIYQSRRNVMFDALHELDSRASEFTSEVNAKTRLVREHQEAIVREFHTVVDRRVQGTRNRCHGDCHLHQVLFTGKDFIFIDFEGRPDQSIGERRIKRPPLSDVVSLIRSFDFAAYATLFGLASGRGRASGVIRDADRATLLPWATAWRGWTHDAFLQGYLEVCDQKKWLPDSVEDRDLLYRTLMLEQLFQEIARDLQYRPAWLDFPLSGLLEAFDLHEPPAATRELAEVSAD